MAAAIMRASGQRAELEQMGASGRQYYLEHLSESQTLDRLSTLLSSLVHQDRASSAITFMNTMHRARGGGFMPVFNKSQTL